jgi:hypothetical protein
VRISQATKNLDVLDIKPPISEGLLEIHLPQNLMGALILQVNFNNTRLIPKV